MFGLVGRHRAAHPARFQRVERRDQAGVGAALDRDMRLVIGKQFAEQAIEIPRRNAAGRDQPLFEHVTRTEPDHRPHHGYGKRGAPDPRQRMVDRGGEVARGVDQRTVEIEADDAEGKVAHAGPHGRSLWNPQ